VHAIAILLLILPSLRGFVLEIDETGTGGAGEAGGGGGGHRGTGGVRSERVQYVAQQATAPVPVPEPPRAIPPLEVKKPEVVPPPTPPAAAASVDSSTNTAEATAPNKGAGGGRGDDGSAGDGPGKNGGKGAGDGPGTGNQDGPGTKGGLGSVYPPFLVQAVILPLPAPGKVKPYELVAVYDVDSLGKATLINWNPPSDASYARRVAVTLDGYRFRPAVTADGRPVRDTVVVRASVGK
jgi:hypothetical protein